MADVRPIHALHYDLDVVGSLRRRRGAALRRDRRRAAGGAARRARPTTRSRSTCRNRTAQSGPQETEDDPYETAAETIEAWREAGALVDDPEPAIWAMTQDYTGPDGAARTRHGILARVRVEDYDAGQVLPHERTLPGPKQDRLDLTRATRHNLSPIFSLSTEDAWPLVEPAIDGESPGARRPTTAAPSPGSGGSATRRSTRAVDELLADAQLLIADGHHRYETAIAYRDEVGGEGDHNYTLMALTGLDDPGLTVFPTHRLLSGFADDPERQRRARRRPARAVRRRPRSRSTSSTRSARRGSASSASTTPSTSAASGCGSRTRDRALDAPLAGKPEAYRRLDAAILETLVLKGIAGMSEDDIARQARASATRRASPDSLAPARGRHLRRRLHPAPDPGRAGPGGRREPTRTCRRSRPTSSPRC